MKLSLSTAAVAELTGASVRMVDHWARTDLLRPSGREATGKGSRRRYTFRDVIVLQAIRKLREGNCPLQKIRTAISYLQTHYPDESKSEALARLTLLTDGNQVYLLTDERQVMEVVTRQLQIGWVVSLGKLILETSRRLDSLPQDWTERVLIGGRAFQFDIRRDRGGSAFVAQCRELPGALREGASVDQALASLKKAVEAVLAHTNLQRPKRQRSTSAVNTG
jgi:DNA-binding transcriptional MerR regulator